MNRPLAHRTAFSACPHDCPSTCALEVELVDAATIGRIYGAKDNDYTAGVICAKVARYAERIHNPNRLLHPLVRKGKKGEGALAADRLGRGARHRRREVRRGRGEARRGGGVAVFLRRHHGAGAARRHPSAAPRQEVLRPVRHDLHQPGVDRLHRRHRPPRRARSARDGEIRSRRDLGDQCGRDADQRDDPCGAGAEGARRQDRGHRRLSQRDDEAGGYPADPEAGDGRGVCLRGDACPLPRRSRRLGLSRALHGLSARARGASEDADAGMGVGDHRALASRRSRASRAPSGRPGAPSSGSAMASRGRGTGR